MAREKWLSLTDASAATGVHRMTLGRWAKAGKLETRQGQVRNLATTLVNLAEVRKLVGDGVRPGRPAKDHR